MTSASRAARHRCTAVLALASVILLMLAGQASAAPLAGSAYDSGDGNQDTQLSGDWQSAQAEGKVKISRDRNDDCFVGGVKELSPDGWAFNNSAGGCTPGKSNIRVAFVNPETLASTSYSHFAFFRNDTTGNTFLTFELNRTPTTWVNSKGTTIPCRSNGDILLSFEVGGSSLQSVLYRWTGDNSGPPSCPNGANGTFTGSGVIPGSRSQGTMNSAQAIANHVDPASFGMSFPANSFGEAAIDIPAVLQAMGESPCASFLQMQVHSRSSSSITSAMIDYTEPVPVNIQSCAAIGEKYADANADGVRDAGENGLAGFEFYADADDDGVRDAGEPTGTSDDSGFYRILDLAAGVHKIREVAKPGWTISAPAPDFYQRALITGGNSIGNDFGNVGPATASGTRFHDLDADGVRDADELGQAGWTYYADLDGDSVKDVGEPWGVSDAGGAWTIENVPAGSHTIREVSQVGWICSAPAACAYARTFASGATVAGLEFGSWAPAGVGGNVFEDLDGDRAALEVGDVALSGWQVYLDANANDAWDLGEIQTTTNAAGNYTLTGVPPGAQTVRVTSPPTGWYCTRPGTTANTCERALTLTSGQLAGGQDFGFTRTATLAGTVFNDADSSGTRGVGESAWTTATTIYADLNANAAPDAGEPSVSTSTGSWTLTGVPAGTVAIRQSSGGFTCTTPAGCAFTLTPTSGQTLSGYEFGNYVATSKGISGTIWLDSNANGVKDAAEVTGVAGITVYADNDKNGSFGPGDTSGVTNSAGAYAVTSTANGTAVVRVKPDTLGSYTCSFPTGCSITVTGLGNGASSSGNDFGVYGPASVSGTLVNDLDADGAKDAGETAGLPGRTIYDDANANLTFDSATERNATTAADGTYTLTGLNPGSHTIRMVTNAGYTCSSPSPCSYVVQLASVDIGGRDFLSWTPATITGTVFEDADADRAAREPGELALGGRSVYLDANDNAVKDITEIAVASDVTTGAYAFAVVPGSHSVRQVLPAGWAQDMPVRSHTVAAVSGASYAGRDLSSHTTATISGRVYDDADFQDDPFESGDSGMPGRSVYLDANDNALLDGGETAVVTDGLGDYTLAVAPGSYTVRTVPANADRACAFPSECAYAIAATSGSSYSGRDFGSYVGATVSGMLFEDADADGQPREGGEPPAPNLRVYLDADGNGVREASEPTTLTAADGSYSIRGVTAQSWGVRLDLSGSWACDSPTLPCAHPVVLTSGATQSDKDFGVHTTATISGHLYTDRDNDGGPQLFGENDQPGRTVYVDANGNDALDGGDAQTVTDELGNYSFTGLQPGDHEIRQELPAGWQPSMPADAVRSVDRLVSGEARAAQNFSSWTTAVITGRVFEDTDADGEFPEASEPGLSPRTVYLDTTPNGSFDGDEPSTVTGAGGSFEFAGLAPGTYTVRPVVSATWTCSFPASCSEQIVVEAGEVAQETNFGLWTNGTIAGVVFSDANGDGDRDDSEGPLAGRVVFVDLDGDTNRDDDEPSQTTDADGGYAFGLRPGTYMVFEVPATGWACTITPCALSARIASGETAGKLDFGNRLNAASLSGTVFDDADADGAAREDGETARAERTVYADVNGNLAADVGEPQTTSGAGGSYTLLLEPGGPHTIRVQEAGRTVSHPAGGEYVVSPAIADVLVGRDFGSWAPATISGRWWDDRDGDGTLGENGDGGHGPGTVYLDLDDDGTRGDDEPTAPAQDDGTFTFPGLKPREYIVRADLPDGDVCTVCSATVAVTSGQQPTGIDVGSFTSPTISGRVVVDANADGIIDAGEQPLPGVVVYDDADDSGTRQDSETSVPTGADGSYTLTVRPGTRTVRIQNPAGFVCSHPADCRHSDELLGGDARTSRDFALYEPASIAGTVYDDADDSGTREPGEGGLDGVTVRLDAGADGRIDATTTTDDGVYAFGGLQPGDYRVTVVMPATYTCSAPSNCRRDPTPTSGSASTGNDFGLYRIPVADLALEKSAPAGVARGETFDYTLTVTNGGPDSAQDVEISDTLPDGVQFVAASAGCDHVSPTVTCSLGTVADGASPVRTITVRAVAAGAIDNTATVSSPTGDPTPENDSDSVGTVAGPSADLEITKTVADATIAQGQTAVYTLTLTNNGPSAAASVVVSDDLPAGVRFVSLASPAGFSCTTPAAGSTGGVTCSAATLADGAVATFTVTVRAEDAGTHSNTAEVSSETPDPGEADNADSVDVDVDATADVALTKTGPASVDAGAEATYVLTVSNEGPSTAHDVVVRDPLPAGMTFVSLTVTPAATCTTPSAGSGGTVSCTIASLADGASVELTLVARAAFSAAEQDIVNTARADGDEFDPDSEDDEASARTHVGPAADVRLVKTAAVAALTQHGQLTYTLKAFSDGPSDATDVTIGDSLPAGMSFVSASAGCAYRAGTVTCELGDIAAGSSTTVTITVRADAAGTQVNTATVSSAVRDPDPSNNAAVATVEVSPTVAAPPPPPPPAAAAGAPKAAAGKLEVTKTADKGAKAVLGSSLAFTIRVANESGRVMRGVVAMDQPSAAVKVDSVRPDKGTCSGLICRLGDLSPGELVVIHVAMTPRKAGAFQNSVVVTSDDGDGEVAGDRAAAGVRVSSKRTTLSLRKAVDRRIVKAGGTVWFTITARNTGKEAASNVRVCDAPAFNTTFVSAKGATMSRGRACWTTPKLAAGRRVSYRVKIRVSGTTRTSATTKSTVTASNAASQRARRSVRVVAGDVSPDAGVTG